MFAPRSPSPAPSPSSLWRDCFALPEEESNGVDPPLPLPSSSSSSSASASPASSPPVSGPSPSSPSTVPAPSSPQRAPADGAVPADAVPYVGDEPRALQSAPELTHETVHEFLSYEDLQSFFKGFSRRHGFEVRWDAGGRPDGGAHSGAARCWCSGVPSATNSLGSINIAAQRIRHEKLTVRGRVKSGCLWRVCFNRTGEKGEWVWHVTKQRQLQHNHDLLPVDQPRPIASLSNVPDSAKDLLSGLLRSGVQGEAVLRRVAQAQLQMQF